MKQQTDENDSPAMVELRARTEKAEKQLVELKDREIDELLLLEAARRVKEVSGVDVVLRRSAAQPLQGQGVVLTAGNGRTAFNNQVATRVERYQSEIRKLIYEALKEP